MDDLLEADLVELEHVVAEAAMKRPQARRFLKAVALRRDVASSTPASVSTATPPAVASSDRDGDAPLEAGAVSRQLVELQQQQHAALAEENQAVMVERQDMDARLRAAEDEAASVQLALRLQREENELARPKPSLGVGTAAEATGPERERGLSEMEPEPEPAVEVEMEPEPESQAELQPKPGVDVDVEPQLWPVERPSAQGTVPKLTNESIREAVQAFCEEGGGKGRADFLHSPKAAAKYGPVQHWDVSAVTNIAGLFKDMKRFNQPIGEWKVDQVTDMSNMFEGAAAFNQPIGEWKVD